MLRAAVERRGSCKRRCAASRNYICYMACVMCASSSPCYQELLVRFGVRLEDTEEHVVRKSLPARRAVFSDESPRHHQPPTTKVAGTRTTMRAERESRAMSEPIGRHSCPGVPLHCDAATSHRIHIFSLHTTDICNIWRSQAPRSAISIPSHTIVRRLGLLSDWR